MRIGRSRPALVTVALAIAMGLSAPGCGAADHDQGAPAAESSPPGHPRPTHRAPPPSRIPDPAGGSGRPGLVPDGRAPVADDLRRLAEAFVGYAVGDADTFPHGVTVGMSLGGQLVKHVDDVVAALSTRRIWRICPADRAAYGAASCPVDLLGPIRGAGLRGSALVYSGELGHVVCATARTGPLPRGRLVVLRPEPQRRTCTTDFALALVADRAGRLRSVDLTIAEP